MQSLVELILMVVNKEWCTGIFQLMFGGKFGDERYDYTREEFANLSK